MQQKPCLKELFAKEKTIGTLIKSDWLKDWKGITHLVKGRHLQSSSCYQSNSILHTTARTPLLSGGGHTKQPWAALRVPSSGTNPQPPAQRIPRSRSELIHREAVPVGGCRRASRQLGAARRSSQHQGPGWSNTARPTASRAAQRAVRTHTCLCSIWAGSSLRAPAWSALTWGCHRWLLNVLHLFHPLQRCGRWPHQSRAQERSTEQRLAPGRSRYCCLSGTQLGDADYPRCQARSFARAQWVARASEGTRLRASRLELRKRWAFWHEWLFGRPGIGTFLLRFGVAISGCVQPQRETLPFIS